MRTLVPLVLGLLAAATPAQNLFVNPGIDGDRGWSVSQSAAGLTMVVDRKEGCARPGSLHGKNVSAATDAPYNWRQVVDLAPAKTRRLRLGAKVRTRGVVEGGFACLVAQCWNEAGEQIHFVACPQVRSDVDWQTMEIVFDAPEATASLFVMAYLMGHGEVWWDDFVCEETDEELVAPAAARPADSRGEDLARGLAGDIPWRFAPGAATEDAIREKKPVLIYVRCTDETAGLVSAGTSIRAEGVGFGDDGHRKDLLFRAGPLTDRAVADLIARRFVPVCATYHLGGEGMGRPGTWHQERHGDDAVLERDAEVGATRPGALRISATRDATRASWYTTVPRPRPGARLRFTVAARAEKDSRIEIDVYAVVPGQASDIGAAGATATDGGWRTLAAEADVPEGATIAVVRARLIGPGRAWFDDFALQEVGRPGELLADGGIERPVGDPLASWGLSSAEIVTPALVVLDLEGKVKARLHRIGALSSELVDRWLRHVLDDLNLASSGNTALDAFRDGDLTRAEKLLSGLRGAEARLLAARIHLRRGDPKKAERELRGATGAEADLLRGHVHLRDGDWEKAEAAFTDAMAGPSGFRDEAAYFAGAAMQRRGRLDLATAAWRAAMGESPFGRKCALASLARGPNPWMAESLRSWPESEAGIVHTETRRPDAFDHRETIARLLAFQRHDGSFTGHFGADGHWDGATTAIAVDGLERWTRKLDARGKREVGAAIERAVGWLDAWARRPAQHQDPFNAPYALVTLVRHDREDAAAALVRRMLEKQLPDGNWTIYHAQRPASFNTAQALIALHAARDAGIAVDEAALRRAALALAAMRRENDLFPYSTADGHEWMTTEHGAIARDPLCETALLAAGRGDEKRLAAALERFLTHHEELRAPTKKLYDYFNARGHGGYFFFYAHRNAVEAARHAPAPLRRKVIAACQDAVRAAREADGTFLDHHMIGRAYATAMALVILGS